MDCEGPLVSAHGGVRGFISNRAAGWWSNSSSHKGLSPNLPATALNGQRRGWISREGMVAAVRGLNSVMNLTYDPRAVAFCWVFVWKTSRYTPRCFQSPFHHCEWSMAPFGTRDWNHNVIYLHCCPPTLLPQNCTLTPRIKIVESVAGDKLNYHSSAVTDWSL